tara:strand:+ start:231 stop:596 length:366 start_codon:yes stop_codon:yes gene_type:complete
MKNLNKYILIVLATTIIFYFSQTFNNDQRWFTLLYLLIPALVVILLGVKFILEKPNWKNYQRSLIIPLSFVAITFFLHIANGTLTKDWSSIDATITFFYMALVFFLTAITNSIITYFKSKK